MSLDESKSDCGGHLCLWHLKVSKVPLSLNELNNRCVHELRTAGGAGMLQYPGRCMELRWIHVKFLMMCTWEDAKSANCMRFLIIDWTVFQDSWIPLWHWQCVKLRVLYLRIFHVYIFFHDRGCKIGHVPIETKSCILYVMCSSIPLCS